MSGSEIRQVRWNSLPWNVMSSGMAQDTININGFIVQYQNTQRLPSIMAQGYKHELEAFRKKLSTVSLFHASCTRILSHSLELAL